MWRFGNKQECLNYVDSLPKDANVGEYRRGMYPTVTTLEDLRNNLIQTKASEDVRKCVEFVFKRYRNAIYIAFFDNLFYFIPFVNTDTPNEYEDYLQIDPILQQELSDDIRSINGYFEKTNKDTRYVIREDKKTWNISNFMVKIEDYISPDPKFATYYYYEIYIFFLEIFSDIDFVTQNIGKRFDFIVNPIDQNLLRKDNKDPMFHIINPPLDNQAPFTQPFPSLIFNKICPVLSFCKHVDYLDIPIPTPDDIARVMKLYSPPWCDPQYEDLWDNNFKFADWDSRIPIAVFRGSNTGWGLSDRTNPRMKIANLSVKNPNLLDAGITSFVARFKKVSTEKYIKRNYTKNIRKVKPLSYLQQTNYKYQVYIEGNVAAYRLGAMLASGSTILKVHSDYQIWFEPFLKEYVHYVPVSFDLSNLIDQIRWCQQHDNECKQIASNARQFYNNFLGNGMFYYTKKILNNIASPYIN